MSTHSMPTQTQPGPLHQLTDDEVKYLQETLYKLIDHAVTRIHYAESRRSGFVTIGGALFAASIAIIALTLSNVHYFPLRLALTFLGLTGALVSFSIWVTYARQTNFRYPFTAATQTWKWFYRDALPDRKAFEVPFHLRMSAEAFETGKRAFTDQWAKFEAGQTTGLVNRRISTHQDLQQIYVLHVNDYFKNLFLTHLRSLLQAGVAAILVTFVTALLVGFALHRGAIPATKGPGLYTVGAITVETAWRTTGRSKTIGIGGNEVQLLLNLRIQNKGTIPVSIAALVAKDSQGMRLPILQESFVPGMPWIIAPNSTVDITGLVWVPAILEDQVQRFETSQ